MFETVLTAICNYWHIGFGLLVVGVGASLLIRNLTKKTGGQ